MHYQSIFALETVATLWLGGGSFGSQIDESTAHDLLDTYAAAGGNVIDTAPIYGAWAPDGANGGIGNSEITIGRWLKSRGCRGHMILATKGGHPDFATGASRLNPTDLRSDLQRSLDHLGTDSIDLYFLHRDDRTIPVAEILGWLAELCADGIIRHLACSNWRCDRLAQAHTIAVKQGLPLLTMNQVAGNLAVPNFPVSQNLHGEQICADAPCFAWHAATQTPVAFYQAQAGGLFAHLDHHPVGPSFPRPALLHRYGNALTYRRHQVAQRLARTKACTSQHIALAWLLHHPFPAFPIIGPTSVAQLQDALHALKIMLTPEEFDHLTRGDDTRPRLPQ